MIVSENGLTAYVFITISYWAFMLSDGALRMLVLLYFNSIGYSPIQLAYMFVLYEVAGIITNLAAGWIAARLGMSFTLYVGLTLQVLALIALSKLDPNWTLGLSVIFVMLVQGLSGVAKDLSKMSAKSAIKVLAPKSDGGLFRWVALLTGSKNAIKGFGFLLGAWLLGLFGFHTVLLTMAYILGAILFLVIVGMPRNLPSGRKGVKFSEVLAKNRNVNWLSFSRIFLFGARDVWFVVAIPAYLYSVLSDGSAESNRSAFFAIGTFMALWIIFYGTVQVKAPNLLQAVERGLKVLTENAWLWIVRLSIVPTILALLMYLNQSSSPFVTVALIIGLLIFGGIFAINSSLHSYLILAFTNDDRVTLDVGFYYMSNAIGRLIGTLLSGVTFQYGGIWFCLASSSLMLLLSAYGASRLKLME